MTSREAPRVIGRYELQGEIGSGGMATVHLGRLHGPGGFSHTFAIKRLREQLSLSPEFVAMFLDEARTAARVQHANVVRVYEVFLHEGELVLVMEYVRGQTIARLLDASGSERPPIAIVMGIALGALAGLHAAHEARDDDDRPLGIVHRDVSPQNILVGTDGLARILDFGVAKAVSRLHQSRPGQIKGKLSYMAPEQLRGESVDRRADIYSMGVVLWELLTGKRLFANAEKDDATLARALQGAVVAPSTAAAEVTHALDDVVLKALAKEPDDRFATARDFAIALEAVGAAASARLVGEWVSRHAPASSVAPDVGRALEETRAAPLVAGPNIRVEQTTPDRFRRTEPPPKPSGAPVSPVRAPQARWIIAALVVAAAILALLALRGRGFVP
ncbi:MAG: serine/threonine protein kinase [Polyangiaceae bacterium]|nr:serine/threonine protein kinase [Polyangiaceae bacterium]